MKKLNWVNDSFLVLTDSTKITFNAYNTPLSNFTGEGEVEVYGLDLHCLAYNVNGQTVAKNAIAEIHFGESYNGVTSIGYRFLYNCRSLTSLNLSGLTNVTTIGRRFLDGHYENRPPLTALDLSGMKNLTQIGEYFLCEIELETLKMGVKTPPTLGITNTHISTLSVPSGAEDAYKKSAWSYQAETIITICNVAGDYGVANAGDRGAANAGYKGAANAGDRGAANAGNCGAANAGYRGAANAGDCGAANAGDFGAANAGDCGAANAGNFGAANAGDFGAANAGNYGAANAGNYGAANAGDNGVAVVLNEGKVKGDLGCILVARNIEYNNNTYRYEVADWACAIVDGEKIKADTWYHLIDGELKEVL